MYDYVSRHTVTVTQNILYSKNHLVRLSIPASLKQSDTTFDTGNSTVSVSSTDKP